MPEKTGRSASRLQSGAGRRRASGARQKSPFGALVETVRSDVDRRMAGFFEAERETARAAGPTVVELVDAVGELCMRGGKRLRAALVVAGYRCVDTEGSLEPALEAGLSVELLHAYFLIHDDWMDQDRVRRGGPAVHAALAKHYGSEHLGGSAAILGGDLLVAHATAVIARLSIPPRRMPGALQTFARMQVHAVAGQQLDLVGGNEDPERTYELKTGSYTVSGPLVLGAQIAGGGARVLDTLERYAMPVGVAFQHRDDLLGAFGDPEQTGKPFASDVRSGKPTLLVRLAQKLATPTGRKALERAVGNERATRRQLERAVDVLEECGARREVEARIDELVARGLDALDRSPLSSEGNALLSDAAQALAHRRS
jgi:geranylgeranyl diphosphate synthase, type I